MKCFDTLHNIPMGSLHHVSGTKENFNSLRSALPTQVTRISLSFSKMEADNILSNVQSKSQDSILYSKPTNHLVHVFCMFLACMSGFFSVTRKKNTTNKNRFPEGGVGENQVENVVAARSLSYVVHKSDGNNGQGEKKNNKEE